MALDDSKFEVLCRVAFDAVIVHDEGRIVEVNDRCAAMFGCEIGEIVGKSILDFTAPEMRASVVAHSRSLNPEPYQSIAIRSNGETFPVEVHGIAVSDSQLRIVTLRDLSEMRQVERSQRKSEERIRILARVAFDGICVHKDGLLIEANESFAVISGYSREELVGMCYEQLFPAGELPKVRERFRSRETDGYESAILRKDGTTLPVEICGTSIPDGERVVAIRDVSARREADRALRASEERYRDVVEHCHDIIGSHDLDGVLLSANAAAANALNATGNALCGSNITQHLAPKCEPTFDDYVGRLQRDGKASGVVKIVTRSGTRRLLEYSSSLRNDGVSKPTAIFVARDITERAELLAGIRHSEQHFRSMIENASDLIAVVELDGTLRYQSPSIDRVLGIRSESVTGQSLQSMVHVEDAPRASQFLADQIAEPAANGMVELRLCHHNGSWRSFEVVARNLTAAGAVTAIVINARDITDRKLLEAQLEQANRISSLGRLAATVAHEFNNVLMGMQPFSELMQRPNVAPKMITKGAWHISNSIQRGKRIALDILRFTQPAQPVTATVDLSEWWEKLQPEMETIVGNAVQMVTKIEPDGIRILADKEQLSQVMVNLVLNARDAMPAGGTLTVKASAPAAGAAFEFGVVAHPERFVHITVSDTGHGMSADVMQHIFEPLFTTKKSGGTGLGLAVAHQILVHNGGFLFAESLPERGTTLHLFFPKAETIVLSSQDDAPRASDLHGHTLLMVEDEPTIVEGITNLLGYLGMKVVAVGRGEHAAAAVIQYRPDMVLLDLGLPDMDGSEVYAILRKQHPFLPVIFATGHGDKRAIHDGLGDRRTRFLQKPFELDALLEMIAELQPKDAAA